MNKLTIIICCLYFITSTNDALADQETAKELFLEGTDKFKSGEFIEAADLFRKAYDEAPNWKLQYNIGQCETAAKQYGRAMEAFESYLALGGDEITESRLDEVESEIDRLRRLVGFIEIVAPEGAVIFIDDKERGTAPLAGRLMVAASIVHEIRVNHNDQQILSRSAKVSGLETITVNATPATEPAEQNEIGHNPSSNSTTEKIASVQPTKKVSPLIISGITLLATGGASAIAGIITGTIALRKNRDLASACKEGICPPNYHDENDQKKNIAITSTILFVAGGTLVVAGTVLTIVGKRKRKYPVTLIPAFGRQTAGIFLSGRF